MASIILENKAQIHLYGDFLPRVLNEAGLPSGRVLLILSDGPLLNHNLGVCMTKSILKYCRDERVFDQFVQECWDCGIAMADKACALKEEYPAYFAYLLGHELGHAHVCLSDVTVHIHYCLIQDFIGEASDGKISQWHELPHEVCFDQFGIYIAERVFSPEKLNEEISQRLDMPECKNRKRLEKMLMLHGSNVTQGLRNILVRFSMPYKDKLVELWQEDAVKRPGNSLAELISDYDALFKV